MTARVVQTTSLQRRAASALIERNACKRSTCDGSDSEVGFQTLRLCTNCTNHTC